MPFRTFSTYLVAIFLYIHEVTKKINHKIINYMNFYNQDLRIASTIKPACTSTYFLATEDIGRQIVSLIFAHQSPYNSIIMALKNLFPEGYF